MTTNSRKARLVIAEDHALMRAGIRALLSAEPDLEIVGEAGDGGEAIRLANTLQPDLLLIDLSMPRTNGSEAIRIIKRRNRNVRILVLTGHSNAEYVRVALAAGANGYVLKADSYQELIAAVRTVLQGKTFISPAVCGPIVSAYVCSENELPTVKTVWETLTSRERQVLKLVAEGNKNREIAAYLSLSTKTVEKHRANLMKKLNLHSSSELTAFAMEHGLVDNSTDSPDSSVS
jgi:two-component system, NarL family, response regulator NreC